VPNRALVASALGWLMAAAGCKPHDEVVVDVVCDALCTCYARADELAACQSDCRTHLAPASVSEACFDCVLAESEDACARLTPTCAPSCPILRSLP
jgi:hypothetical protein